MFGWRKDAAKISMKCPLFHVRYIGCTETFVANGKGCSYAPVQRLWDNSPGERHLRRVTVQLSQTGISMRDTEKNDEVITDFRIEDISFCNTDTLVNERIFSWICRDRDSSSLQCHAVLCSTKQKAQTMALVLSRAFQMAYRDWKANKKHREMVRKPLAGGQNWTRKDHVDAQSENKVLSPGTPPNSIMTSTLHSGPSTAKGSFDNDTTSLPDDEPSASPGFENCCILDPEVEAALADVADINDDFDEARSELE